MDVDRIQKSPRSIKEIGWDVFDHIERMNED